MSRFQVLINGSWKDYAVDEDRVLTWLFRSGQNTVRVTLRGQLFEYDFVGLQQRNLETGYVRQIRLPKDWGCARCALYEPRPPPLMGRELKSTRPTASAAPLSSPLVASPGVCEGSVAGDAAASQDAVATEEAAPMETTVPMTALAAFVPLAADATLSFADAQGASCRWASGSSRCPSVTPLSPGTTADAFALTPVETADHEFVVGETVAVEAPLLPPCQVMRARPALSTLLPDGKSVSRSSDSIESPLAEPVVMRTELPAWAESQDTLGRNGRQSYIHAEEEPDAACDWSYPVPLLATHSFSISAAILDNLEEMMDTLQEVEPAAAVELPSAGQLPTAGSCSSCSSGAAMALSGVASPAFLRAKLRPPQSPHSARGGS